ncbi:MAG: sigma 54 modulation/S30EA ribosomal C-terminal domain-containing protein, partial [Enterococcus gilvus]|nr:sigma 54 modulation/S30EA ribosomal C-terminal domain-containing protein [Enterococcus sp.]
ERQIRKFKTKINRKARETSLPTREVAVELNDEAEETSELEIVRTKRLSLKPMGSEEAVLQMNMLGHNFFIFEDAETNGTSIVYRRKDGKYGLIETD